MGLRDTFARLLERRASPENPSTNLSNPSSWLVDWMGGGTAKSGSTVNAHSALKVSSVYACVRVLAETIASLPLEVYERGADDTRRRALDHPMRRILHDEPSELLSSFAFRETLQAHTLTWGNGYAEIIRDGRMGVRELRLLMPDRTEVDSAPGRLYYETHDGNGQNRRAILPENIIHVPGLAFDGHRGYSPITLAREAVGLSLATEDFGSSWFGNGSRPSGILSHPARLQPEAAARLRDSWNVAHGGLGQSHKAAVLEEGVTWTAIGIPPEDAQFLETRRFQVAEIARIFRVPLHMIGDLEHATFSNIEHQAIEFVTHTVRPWLVRWEQELTRKLFTHSERERYFVEFNVDGLLRGDIKSRFESYATGRQWGWLSADDIRKLENMNPLPDGQGESYLVPMNMVPADQAGAPPAPPAATTPTSEGLPDANRSIKRFPGADQSENRSMTARKEITEAARRPFERVAAKQLKFEAEQIAAAARRILNRRDNADDFRAWVTTFYQEHEQRWFRGLFPVIEDFVASMANVSAREIGIAGSTWTQEEFLAVVEEFTGEAVSHAVGGSQAEIAELIARSTPEELEGNIRRKMEVWATNRPTALSRELPRGIGNGTTRRMWRKLGVRYMTWSTVGENCPLCMMMNGRTKPIEEGFVRNGETLDPRVEGTNPMTATRDITYPPLHRGCDCTITAS